MLLHAWQSAAFMLLVSSACAPRPVNPSFPVSTIEARWAMHQMRAAPRPLARPVIVLGGFHDPALGPAAIAGQLRRAFNDDRIIEVSYPLRRSFDECRDDVIAAVEKSFPWPDTRETVEVDVIGLSMGGLVGRYCATERPGGKRLKVRRLFTVSSPHRGAAGAALPSLSRLHLDMRAGSEFLRELEAAEAPGRRYELVPYVRLGDWIVGAANAAPAGANPWWVANEPLQPAHVGAATDARILADIARRLRGEPTFTRAPAATLPASLH